MCQIYSCNSSFLMWFLPNLSSGGIRFISPVLHSHVLIPFKEVDLICDLLSLWYCDSFEEKMIYQFSHIWGWVVFCGWIVCFGFKTLRNILTKQLVTISSCPPIYYINCLLTIPFQTMLQTYFLCRISSWSPLVRHYLFYIIFSIQQTKDKWCYV